MRRLFVSDMDGTLLNAKKELPANFIEVLGKITASGGYFVFGSGRSYQNLHDRYGSYSNYLGYVCDNGATVAFHDRILFQDTLEKEELEEVEQLRSLSEKLVLVYCGTNHFFVQYKGILGVEQHRELCYYYPVYTEIDSVSEIQEGIIKVALLYMDDIQANISNQIHLSENLVHPVTGYTWIDVFHKTNSKGLGISILQERLGIGPEETYVFGDYFNDLSMCDYAEHSYAMSNAVDEVKQSYREVIGSNEEAAVMTQILKILEE